MLPGGFDGPPVALIDEFCARYSNAKTRQQYLGYLTDLFVTTGRCRPCDLTEADVLAWCGRATANNSIRPPRQRRQ